MAPPTCAGFCITIFIWSRRNSIRIFTNSAGRMRCGTCFGVPSSLDSMVVGEAQILGQVKEAYATARAIGAVRGQLDQLFSRAFAVAKRVRSETAVGTSSVSIASVAVELAKKIFGSLQGKR